MSSPTDLAMAWRAALGGMRTHEPPCPGITAALWPAMHGRALDFLEAYGIQAAELGWTATDLCGVHPTSGTIRVDYTGALMLSTAIKTREVRADGILFASHFHYRDVPGRGVGVAIWEFRR